MLPESNYTAKRIWPFASLNKKKINLEQNQGTSHNLFLLPSKQRSQLICYWQHLCKTIGFKVENGLIVYSNNRTPKLDQKEIEQESLLT